MLKILDTVVIIGLALSGVAAGCAIGIIVIAVVLVTWGMHFGVEIGTRAIGAFVLAAASTALFGAVARCRGLK